MWVGCGITGWGVVGGQGCGIMGCGRYGSYMKASNFKWGAFHPGQNKEEDLLPILKWKYSHCYGPAKFKELYLTDCSILVY